MGKVKVERAFKDEDGVWHHVGDEVDEKIVPKEAKPEAAASAVPGDPDVAPSVPPAEEPEKPKGKGAKGSKGSKGEK
jgi:hypothetical protein